MKVHSNGGYGEDAQFVYVDKEGNLLTACNIGYTPIGNGINEVPEFCIYTSEFDMEITIEDPDIKFECLGEL